MSKWNSTAASAEERTPVVRSNKKFVIGGVAAVLLVGYLLFVVFGASGSFLGHKSALTYYLTVAELQEKGSAIYGRPVRVSGLVVGETIQYQARDLVLRFELRDAAESNRLLPVVYHGPRPDMLRDGAEAVVEGTYTAEGVFQATNLMLKCPSKYEAAATEEARQ